MTKKTVEATPLRIVPHNLSGKESGPKRDMVLMGAGATLADNKGDGIGAAREAIPSGAALEKLRRLREAAAVRV